MTRLERLIERLVHHGERKPAVQDEYATPADVLGALEWADTDSGEELMERAEKVAKKEPAGTAS